MILIDWIIFVSFFLNCIVEFVVIVVEVVVVDRVHFVVDDFFVLSCIKNLVVLVDSSCISFNNFCVDLNLIFYDSVNIYVEVFVIDFRNDFYVDFLIFDLIFFDHDFILNELDKFIFPGETPRK